MKSKLLITLLLTVCVRFCSLANNIQVSNTSFTSQNTTLHTVQVQFTLSWENSWRVTAGPGNWDAAWVFVKYRVGGGPWLHASLNNTNFVAPAGSTIAIGLLTPGTAFNINTNPGKGAFIYRSANGSGTFTVTNAQLQWDYGSNGLGDNDVVDIQVFAIEHVYVPQGTFAVGDGQTGNGQFTLTTINTGIATVPPVGSGSLGGQAGGYPTGQLPPSNAIWPNGYNAFYCMKNEVSQQGYADFLNCLTRTQQQTHIATNISTGTIANRYVMFNSPVLVARNGIRCDGTVSATGPITFYCDYDGDGVGGEVNDGKDIASCLNQLDLWAYLDWAGLRPITEMEYEKCSRGTLPSIAGEYAWGNAIAIPASSILNPGLSSEEPNTSANVISSNGGINGPLRVGSVAGTTTSRQQAGAGYYGIMEMTGNLTEAVIYITSVSFLGTHGDGLLDGSGSTTNGDWPPMPANGTNVNCIRGGSFMSGIVGICLSCRTGFPFVGDHGSEHGGRGGRTAL
ncbi:MAG: hypothetical protein ABI763_09155 [Bacteroidota bacterium]